MFNFNDLKQANIARQVEWENNDNPFSVLYFSNALAGEVGEVCNVVKKMERSARGAVGSKSNNQDLADELADVIIYADLLAEKAGINLDIAIISKFNETSVKYGLKTRI